MVKKWLPWLIGAAILVGGSNLPVSTVSINQTTPGTTNGVVVNSSALPTGGATAALQTTGNTTLSSIYTAATSAIPGCAASPCATTIGNVGLVATPTGGATGGTILSAASNNATSIKGSPGTLTSLTWLQTTTTLMDIRFYDVAGTPTCSSATGMKLNFVVQSNAISGGATVNLGPSGIAFTTGIGICITGANANNDNSSATTGLNVIYGYN
jgi:hypothetical protein